MWRTQVNRAPRNVGPAEAMCLGAQTPQEGGLVAEQLTQVRLARPGVSMASMGVRAELGRGSGWQAYLSAVGNCCSSFLDAWRWVGASLWLCPRERGLHVFLQLGFM